MLNKNRGFTFAAYLLGWACATLVVLTFYLLIGDPDDRFNNKNDKNETQVVNEVKEIEIKNSDKQP